MSDKNITDPNAPVVSAEELRMAVLRKATEEMDKERKARDAERDRLAKFTDAFMREHVTENERAAIRNLVMSAVNNGKFEAMVYSFPSSLCTDSGRAINSNSPDWPDTLQGKAKEMFERYQEFAKPQGYRLKAMIINFPNGMPGDVGFFLNWAPETF